MFKASVHYVKSANKISTTKHPDTRWKFSAHLAVPQSIFSSLIRSHILRTKSCLEAELAKKETHLEWEREHKRRRVRREEMEKELQRQVILREAYPCKGMNFQKFPPPPPSLQSFFSLQKFIYLCG